MKPAFQMAFEEDILPKNPFEFKLCDVIKNDSLKRIALTKEQTDIFMTFIKGVHFTLAFFVLYIEITVCI